VGSIVLMEYAVLLLTLGCFLVAALAEIRSYKKGPTFFLRMAEIAAGVIALWWMTTVGQSTVRSWTMVCGSLLLGGLVPFSKYVSRVAVRFVLMGSAILAFLWYFKGAYHH
jgi:hypothetical protein